MNKIKKCLLLIVVMIIIVTSLCRNIVYADATVRIKMDTVRYDSNGNQVEIYAIGNGIDQKLFQLLSVNNENQITGTNFYCLNATVGASWVTGSVGTTVDYDKQYDLNNISLDGVDSAITPYLNVQESDYLAQLLWVIDNMYVKDGIKTINDLLAEAGIVYDSNYGYYCYDRTINPSSVFSNTSSPLYTNAYGNPLMAGYYYEDENYDKVDVILSDYPELVEAIQQAVIWYFTNYKAEEGSIYTTFNNYTSSTDTAPKDWLKYASKDTPSDLKYLYNKTVTVNSLTVNVGSMLQEQADILYNYLIDSANAAANEGYSGSELGTMNLTYTGSNPDKKIVKEGTNYKIGPIKASTTGNTNINNLIILTGDNTDITSNATLKNSSGTTINEITKGEDFFVVIPQNIVDGDITINVTGATSKIEKKLLLVSTTNDNLAEQPIVNFYPTTTNLSKSLTVEPPKTFDLALRKYITAVSTDGNFENTETTTTYNRVPSIENEEITKLGSTTATYDSGKTAKKTHSKTAVEVTTGSRIRYTIRVYNEGEVDGKATEITDYLPSGLKLAENSTINTTYGWNPGENGKVTTNYLNNKTISALSGTTLNYEDVQIECEVAEAAGATEKSLKNVAEITGSSNEYNYEDRDSAPDNVNTDNYTPTNPEDGRGEQDDDDYEEIKIPALPKNFDLSLRKFITAVSTDGNFENTESTTTYNREPSIENEEITKLGSTTATYDEGKTAKKTHSKKAVEVTTGSKIRYTIRVYNEGEVDGKATEITDYLPSGLKLAENSTINTTYGWNPGENGKVTTNYLNNKTISALSGTTLSYEDVQIECEVTEVAGATEKSMKNVAEITGASNEYGYTDRDSTPDNVNKDNYTPTNPEDGRGEQDDDDYEEIKIPSAQGVYTIRLQKVSSENENTNLSGAEFSVELAAGTTKNITSGTSYVTIAENVAITGEGTDTIKITETNAPEGYKKLLDELTVTITKTLSGGIYGISAVSISDTTNASYDLNNNVISITIKDEPIKQDGVYSLILVKEDEEGEQLNSKATFEINGEEKDITGRLVIAENIEINANNVEKQDIYTIKETKAPDEYSSFDGTITVTVDKKLDGTKYVIEKIDYKVIDGEGNDITSTKDAKVYLSKDGNIYVEVKNYEIKNFDLSLRKFITDIGGKEVTSRIPQISYENNKITYNHTKETEKIHVGDIVTYTIRAFNEGEIAGFAEKITDDIPEFLEYLPDNKTNKKYRWVMYDKDGKETASVKDAVKIVSDYTSKANGEIMMKSDNLKENPNLLKAFDTDENISDENPGFIDIKVAFKVKNPNSNTITIVNNAQISEDADENGDSVNDIDSIPDKWNDGEDDQDYESVSVEYFDLSLLKYVKKAMITDNDKTRTIKTGNNGSDKDIIPKVEVNRKRITNTIVRFEYTIEIKNEGDIAGYAKEITDYVPKGLKFYKEDNEGWKNEGNNVISTKLLKDTLLEPGQSATVKVILRRVNGENNLGVKTNVAEISEDYNEKEVPDRDSIPDNKKQNEDDIDNAQVILTISTGFFENPIPFMVGALIILVIFGLGIIAIKRYVI